MATLQEKLRNDLKTAMKEKDEDKKNTIRVIMGEFARMDKKEIPDNEVIPILKKLIKSENEMLERSGLTGDSPFIRIIEQYLPKMASEEEILSWIQANVDFSKYKNKMQAMKDIMQHFGSGADGNTVKKVLQDI